MQRQFTATVYIIKEEKALLLMHPKFHKWLPPGGHLEENETPHECALREVLEETGLKIGFYQDESFRVSHKNACSIPRPFLCLLEDIPAWNQTPMHQHIDFIFVGYPIEEGLVKEFSYRWFSKEEVLALKEEEIFPDVKQIISEIFNSKFLSHEGLNMQGLFIASTGQHIGKTTACLGIFSGLHKLFSHLGYMKPIGQQHITTKQGLQVDKDVLVFKKHFALTDSLESMSPIVIPSGFTRDFLDQKIHIDDLRKKLIRSFKTIQENKQLVLVEGTGHCGVGSIIHLNNAQVAKELKLPLILISSGGLGSSFDDLTLNVTLCDHYKLSILGVILNRVLPCKQEMVQHYMRKALKRWNLPLLGCIPFDPFLSTFSMGDFELLFQTPIITGSNHRFRHFDRIRLVATSVESYREMILPNQLIITPSNREDIILATLNKHLELLDSHKEGLCAGMVLTGDSPPPHGLIEQLAKADIPVLYTPLHSYTAMQKISAFTAKISTEDIDKIKEAISIAESHIDFPSLQLALNSS